MTASEENITAYIFRVEYEKETSYVLQSSITDNLDLSFFTCEEVNLSLAVVNINGSSDFTSPTPICVHGVLPLAPGNFRVTSIVDDLRPEFFGHAVISLEWDMAEGAVAYELLVIPRTRSEYQGMCGDRMNFSIDANATTYTLMASNSSSFFLQFGINDEGLNPCVYTLRLFSVPGRKRRSIGVSFRDRQVTLPEPPPIDLSCSGVTDDQTGLYNVRIEFSYSNVSLINEAINNYSIIIRNRNFSVGIPPIAPLRETLELHNVLNGRLIQQSLKDVYICADGVASFTIELTERGENISVVFTADNFCPQAVNTTLFIMLHFTVNLTAGPWWRPLPKSPMMCTISLDIVPPSPVPVGSIELLQDLPLPLEIMDNNQRVLDRFNLSWSPPLEPRGDIQQYVVFVGSSLQEGTDTFGFETATNGNETTIAIENFTIPFNPPACLYVQIRSIGEFADSNWSDPFFIPIIHGFTAINCSFIIIVPPDSEVSSFRAGVIAESVIIFFLILLVIALCVLLYMWPRYCGRRSDWQSPSVEGGWSDPYNAQYRAPLIHQPDGSATGPMGNGWEIPLQYIVREQQLGEGSFGKVAKGFIRGPVPGTYTMKNRLHASVAMKFLKDHPSEQEKKDFASEISLMKRIGFSKHPHVVGLYGCVTVPQPVCILLEYLEYGDLLSYLQNINEEVNRMTRQDTQRPVSVVTLPATSMYTNLGDVEPDNLLSFAFQIASGMEFLSSLDVIHRDLACRNILVGDKKVLKISDFGLSREGDVYMKTTSGKLPFKWMALESLHYREFTVQSDVWAYGVVLWEIATLGQFPYPSIANEEMLDHILEGNRLEQPSNCSDEVYKLMIQCWSVKPGERPSISDLKENFEAMLLEHTNYLQFTSLTQGPANGVANGVTSRNGSVTSGAGSKKSFQASVSAARISHSDGSATVFANESAFPGEEETHI
jgi:serine/threonine protein kinase